MNRTIPPVVKGLLIINVAMFLLTLFFQSSGTSLIDYLSLYYPTSAYFRPYQLVTHMFMHGGWSHILFNMFALWMFGSVLENVWGPKRFLFFYLYCGLGAAAVQIAATGYGIWHVHDIVNSFMAHPTPGAFDSFVAKYKDALTPDGDAQYSQIYSGFNSNSASSAALAGSSYTDQAIQFVQTLANGIIDAMKNVPTLGASGAIFGLLVAFGYLFPNTELYIMFIPIPVKAKYAVIGYAALELFFGFSGYEPGVAHFAHLGGALFGFLLLLYWNKTGKTFY